MGSRENSVIKSSTMLRSVPLALTLTGLLALSSGCSRGSSGGSKSTNNDVAAQAAATDPTQTSSDGSAATDETQAAGTPNAVTVAVPDYPALYCSYAGQVKTRSDVSQELSYFCRDGKPTPELIALREKLLAEPGHIRPRVLKEKHTAEEDKSEFILAWGYYVPIRPFEVKSRPLYEYIAKNIDKEGLVMTAVTSRQGDDTLDHGLHLWSATMNYDLSVKATSGLTLDSLRGTQYNMYQVQSGNEEMGFGVETLSDENNPDYYRSVMINLSFNDGSGYNDGKGGALVFNLLHIVINNRGFPVTASQTIDEIGNFLADAMYDGLKQ